VRAHVHLRERGVGENESALGIQHYALQLFGCVSLGNSLFGNWTSYSRQEMEVLFLPLRSADIKGQDFGMLYCVL